MGIVVGVGTVTVVVGTLLLLRRLALVVLQSPIEVHVDSAVGVKVSRVGPVVRISSLVGVGATAVGSLWTRGYVKIRSRRKQRR